MEVVDNIAAFGLAYVLIKFFVGVVEEVKQVGVVLVQDRPGFHKILVCILVMAFFIFIFSIVICEWMDSVSCAGADISTRVAYESLS